MVKQHPTLNRKHTVTGRLTHEMKEKMLIIRNRTGKTIEQQIREALTAYLQEAKKAKVL